MSFLNWEHESVTLAIGEGHYTFRTLSFYDVAYLSPHLLGVQEAVQDGRNIKMIEHVDAIIKHLCPEFHKSPDYKHLKPEHIDVLMAFYKSQDWGRIKTMLALDGSETAEPESTPEQTHEKNLENFRRLCFVAVGKNVNEAPKFADRRFEFVADVFIEMHARWKAADEQAHPDRMTIDGFKTMAMMGARQVIKTEN